MNSQTHSQRANGRDKANFRFSDSLAAGDVLLSTVRSSPLSATIRRATNSPFSHAALYRGEMNMLEAIGFGVTNYSIVRRGVADPSHVCVLRLRNKITNRQSVIDAAIAAAENYRGRQYWTAGAILSVLGNEADDERGRMYCSYFVAQVYEDAGLTLCPDVFPRDVTPVKLYSSPLLINVTSEVLLPISEWSKSSDPMEALDIDQRKTAAHKILRHDHGLLDQVAEVFLQFGLPPPRTLDETIPLLMIGTSGDSQLELDTRLARVLDSPEFRDPLDRAGRPFPTATETAEFYSHAPLHELAALIDTFTAMRDKWIGRSSSLESIIGEGRRLESRLPLRTLSMFQERKQASLARNERAIASVKSTISELEQLYRKRAKDTG